MAIPLKFNTASQEFTFGQALDSANGNDEEGGLTIANTDIKLHKAGTTTLANKNSGGAIYISNGVWYGTFNAADVDTYGPMTMYIHVAGALAMKVEFEVMNATAYDALYGTDNFDVNVFAISDDSTAADNLELQYDGTGITGDTFPAKQSQVSSLAATPGVGARPFVPTTITVVAGTNASGSADDLANEDGNLYTVDDNAGTLTLDLDYQLEPNTESIQFILLAAAQGNSDNLTLQFYDQVGAGWDTIDTLTGANGLTYEPFDKIVVSKYTNDTGLFQVRITGTGLTSATLTINVGVTYGVASSTGITNGSTITLTESAANQNYVGNNWNLVLGSQNINNMYAEGGTVSGTGPVTSGHAHFNHCDITNNVIVGPSHFDSSGFDGTWTMQTAGEYEMISCHTNTPAAGNITIDGNSLGSATSLVIQDFKGSITFVNLTASHTFTVSGTELGNIVLGGADATIKIRGIYESLTNNLTGSPTVTVEAIKASDIAAILEDTGTTGVLLDSTATSAQLVDDFCDEVITGVEHNVNNSLARIIRETKEIGVYDNGGIWVDSINGVSGSTAYENGTVDNPVDNEADLRSLIASTGFKRVFISPGSSLTLAGAYSNTAFIGKNWALALGGQTVNGMVCLGAVITGIGNATSIVRIEDCNIGAATMPPGKYANCGIGDSGGTFTAASAGEYIFENSFSVVPGSGTPNMVFTGLAAPTGINNRGWRGGATYTLDSDCMLSHEVVAGGGTSVTTGGADVEIRGITRSISIVLGTGTSETVQFCGITGPINISGSATAAVVNLYGIGNTITNTSTGSTVTNKTVNDNDINSILEDTSTTLPALIDDLAIKKNTSGLIHIEMVLTSDHVTPATGLTVTAQRLIDSGTYANVSGSMTEISNGTYRFDYSAADANGDLITWKFSSGTADDTKLTFKTVA